MFSSLSFITLEGLSSLLPRKLVTLKVENGYVLRIMRTLKPWYHLCPVVLNIVLLSNSVFLLKVCPIITMTDFNLTKLLHTLTFKMTLKAAKCHSQKMQVTAPKVSNTDKCIIVTHNPYLCPKYKFSFYREKSLKF